MSPLKSILITGATGKQGGALLTVLLALNNPAQFKIYALSRDANSASSKKLASLPNVQVIEGNMSNAPTIFSKLPASLYGVFSVQIPLKPRIEEAQDKAIVDAAVKHEKSDVDPTPIPHFASKFNIEHHLKKVTAEKGTINWTVFRPVAFMENFTPDIAGRGMATMWRFNDIDSKLQLVSSKDVCNLAAAVFQKPELFRERSLSLAADELTWGELNATFMRVTGKGVPLTYDTLGKAFKWILHEQLRIMFDWFKSDGFGADPDELKKVVPDLMTFEEWLRTESAWKQTVSDDRRGSPDWVIPIR